MAGLWLLNIAGLSECWLSQLHVLWTMSDMHQRWQLIHLVVADIRDIATPRLVFRLRQPNQNLYVFLTKHIARGLTAARANKMKDKWFYLPRIQDSAPAAVTAQPRGIGWRRRRNAAAAAWSSSLTNKKVITGHIWCRFVSPCTQVEQWQGQSTTSKLRSSNWTEELRNNETDGELRHIENNAPCMRSMENSVVYPVIFSFWE